MLPTTYVYLWSFQLERVSDTMILFLFCLFSFVFFIQRGSVLSFWMFGHKVFRTCCSHRVCWIDGFRCYEICVIVRKAGVYFKIGRLYSILTHLHLIMTCLQRWLDILLVSQTHMWLKTVSVNKLWGHIYAVGHKSVGSCFIASVEMYARHLQKTFCWKDFYSRHVQYDKRLRTPILPLGWIIWYKWVRIFTGLFSVSDFCYSPFPFTYVTITVIQKTYQPWKHSLLQA